MIPTSEPLKLVSINSITEAEGYQSTKTQAMTTKCTGFVLDEDMTQCFQYDQLPSLIRMEVRGKTTYAFGEGNGEYDPDPDPDPDDPTIPELIPFNVYFSTPLPTLQDAVSILEKSIGKKIYGIGFVAYAGDKKYSGPDWPASGQDLSQQTIQFVNGNGVRYWPDVAVTFYFYFVTDRALL